MPSFSFGRKPLLMFLVSSSVGMSLSCNGVPQAVKSARPTFVPRKIDGPTHDPAAKSFWYGPFSEGCAVFDIDGDGDLDITAGRNWYENPGWKKHADFREHAFDHNEFVNNCGERPTDVDGDGDIDLISAGWQANGVWWYENPGGGSRQWKSHKIFDSDWTEGLIVEDIDGDGDDDILINHWGSKEGQGVTWIEKLEGAAFKGHVLGKEGDRHGIGLGDLDGDGRKDIITPDGWWQAPEDRSGGSWTFRADYKLRHEGGIRMLVADANGDGRKDIIYGHGHNYGLSWIEQKSGRTFVNHDASPSDYIRLAPGQFHTLVLADVNQDGRMDFATGKRLRGHSGSDPSAFEPLGLFWFELDGDFTEHVICYNHVPWYEDRWKENPPPSYAIGTGMNINVVDVNGDDRVDIVVAGKSGLYLLVNQGVPEVK